MDCKPRGQAKESASHWLRRHQPAAQFGFVLPTAALLFAFSSVSTPIRIWLPPEISFPRSRCGLTALQPTPGTPNDNVGGEVSSSAAPCPELPTSRLVPPLPIGCKPPHPTHREPQHAECNHDKTSSLVPAARPTSGGPGQRSRIAPGLYIFHTGSPCAAPGAWS